MIDGCFLCAQEGCGFKLADWFEVNKIGWVASLAIIGAVEFLAAAVALFILRRLHVRNHRPRTRFPLSLSTDAYDA